MLLAGLWTSTRPFGASLAGFKSRDGGTVISIRRVKAADAVALRDARLRALQSDPLAFGSTYAREAAAPPSDWERWARDAAAGGDKATFLALGGESPIGIGGGYRSDGSRFELYSMWVAPESRRAGVGRRLVEAVATWAADAGGTELALWVTQDGARAMYRLCGFADDGRRQPLVHAPEVIEIGMTRVLRS